MQARLSPVIVLALLLLAAPGPASSVVFTANVLNDVADTTPGDGSCDVIPTVEGDPRTVGEQCSLRSAVQEANATPALDFIDLAPFGPNPGPFTYTLTIVGVSEDAAATGDLDVTTPIDISSDLISGSFNTTLIDAKRLKDRIFDVHSGGSLEVRRASLLHGKSPKAESGGCLRSAGGLTLGNIFMFRCASSDDGGCMSVTGGTAALSNTIFSTCKAKNEGGGLEQAALASVTLLRTSFGACKGGTGGAIAARGDLELRDVTIDGNSAKLGGGIALLGAGTTTILSTTISENGKVNLDTSQNTGVVTLSNTIVWGAKTDCVGPVTSTGGNLEGAVSCAFASTNDQQSQDPLLSPLNFYGGFVLTRSLASTSPAIDHGIDGATCVSPDARLVARQDVPSVGVAICDAGAVEFKFVP